MTRTPPKLGEKGYERVEHDNYRTPPWVTEILIPHLVEHSREWKRDICWEPACGDKDMAAVLNHTRHFKRVVTMDIRKVGADFDNLNFLGFDLSARLLKTDIPFPNMIVTNPPYHSAAEFIRRALSITLETSGLVAMLLLHEFDAPASHREFFRHAAYAKKIVLPRRIRWLGFEDKASPRQVHAWYVWDWASCETPNTTVFA